jgi:anti-anti-sigma regulatory factor
MFRIQRWTDGKNVVLTLSGRIKGTDLTELQKLLECEAGEPSLTLDLKEVKIVDLEAVSFLASCEAKRIELANCPAYIREWIEREAGASKVR